MWHVDNNTGTPTMPTIAPVAETVPQWFTEGGPGDEPSVPGADTWNIWQAELLNILTAANVVPDKFKLNQIAEAIQLLIGQGIENAGLALEDHTHPISEVEGLQGALDGKSPTGHTHTPAEAGAAPAVHSHAIADVSGLQGALDGKAATGHTHTPAEAGAAPSEHTHALTLAGDATGTATLGPNGVTLTVTVTDDSHAHVIGNVDGLQGALDGKSPTSHTHTPASIGAAPTSHTHTAAQGNQDIVAGGTGQVGTYGFFLHHASGVLQEGVTKAGSTLGWSSVDAEESDFSGGAPSGTWKLLGYYSNNSWSKSLWLRIA